MQLTVEQTRQVIDCLKQMYKICTGNDLFREFELIAEQLQPLGIDYMQFVEVQMQQHMSLMGETMQNAIEDMKLKAAQPEFLEGLRNQMLNSQELAEKSRN